MDPVSERELSLSRQLAAERDAKAVLQRRLIQEFQRNSRLKEQLSKAKFESDFAFRLCRVFCATKSQPTTTQPHASQDPRVCSIQDWPKRGNGNFVLSDIKEPTASIAGPHRISSVKGSCSSALEWKVDISPESQSSGPTGNTGSLSSPQDDGSPTGAAVSLFSFSGSTASSSGMDNSPTSVAASGKSTGVSVLGSSPEVASSDSFRTCQSLSCREIQVHVVDRRALSELRAYKGVPPDGIIFLWAACLLILGCVSIEDTIQKSTIDLWKGMQKFFVGNWRGSDSSNALTNALTSASLEISKVAGRKSLLRASALRAQAQYAGRLSKAALQLDLWVASVLSHSFEAT